MWDRGVMWKQNGALPYRLDLRRLQTSSAGPYKRLLTAQFVSRESSCASLMEPYTRCGPPNQLVDLPRALSRVTRDCPTSFA